MTDVHPGHTDRLWDAWNAYQDAERRVFQQYVLSCRNLLSARDSALNGVRAAERTSWYRSIDGYRAVASRWMDKWNEDDTVTGADAQKGIEQAWQAYQDQRQQAWAELGKAEASIRDKYRYDMATVAALYQRDLQSARLIWYSAIRVPSPADASEVSGGNGC